MEYYALLFNQVGLEDIICLGPCPDDEDAYEYFEKELDDLTEPMYGSPQLWSRTELESMIKDIKEVLNG